MPKKRRDPYYHRGEPGIWSKIFKILGIVLVIAAIFGAVWATKYFQPRRIGWQDMGTAAGAVPANVTALHDQSLDLERKFHDVEKMGTVTPADVENLRQALKLENDYLTQAHMTQKGSERLVQLTEGLETYEAKPLSEQSIDLENQALTLEKAGTLPEARKLYGQAADLEERILREFPHSKYALAAPRRYTVLQRQVKYLTAMPLNDESVAAEAAAKEAAAKEDWPKALENFQHALELQQRINREFPEQSFASSGRLKNLIDQVTALQSLPDHQKIIQLMAAAKAAEGALDYAKAAELYQEAERQQRNLVAAFPKSIFATDANFMVSLEDLRQTALSRPLANEIVTQAAALFDDLRHRRVDRAAANIAPLQQKAERFRATFPHSKLIDDELQQRLDYLAYKRADLATVQELVYGQLLAEPGQTRFLLEKQEVPQSLYKLVTGGNPSRHAGDQLPVDSVNWNEAQEFCRRLSWILERPVRLPTVDEFNLALGPTDKINVAAMSWNNDNADGKTQAGATKAANANGYYDLLGNVAEWLERPGDYDDQSAPVIGGSAQTTVDAILTVKPTSLSVTNRNGFTGFRLVVDGDDTAPLLPKTTITPDKPPTADTKTDGAK
jgi:hypothetical protein